MSAPLLLAGTAHPELARTVASAAGADFGEVTVAQYPDARVVTIETSVRGRDVFVFQPTPPASEVFLFELLLIADAARRAGAERITAVVPYLGYARQDRRAGGHRMALGARVVATMLSTGGVDRVVVVDLHAPAIEGFFAVPAENLEAFPLLSARLGRFDNGVVIAPDLGAAKLADRYAGHLGLPVAVVHKSRLSGSEVAATSVTGDVHGRYPVIVDDMITTGGTVAAALTLVREAGAAPGGTVVATHALFSPGAVERLAALRLDRLLVTNSVPVHAFPGVEVIDLSPLLAKVIRHLHSNRSLEAFRARV